MSVEQSGSSTTNRVQVTNLDTRYVSLVRQISSLEPTNHDPLSRVVGVTSSLPSEGTTTVAANIALTAAGLDNGPVLLVDANDAKPSLHRKFRMRMRLGLQNALSGEHSALECVTPSQIERLSLVLNGSLEPNETPLYSVSSIDEMILEWRDAFSLIVFDLPAVSHVANGSLLASRLDGVLLVVQGERVERNIVAQTTARLRHDGVNLMGAVFNNVTKGKGDLAW